MKIFIFTLLVLLGAQLGGSTGLAENTVVVWGGTYSGQLMVEEMARAFLSQREGNGIEVRFKIDRWDDERNIEKLCDRDCDVLYHREFPSDKESALLKSRFSRKTFPPQSLVVGFAQVAVITNRANAVRQLSLGQIRDLLKMEGSYKHWSEIGGSIATVKCYGEGRDSTSRSVIRHACMMLGPDMPTGYYLYRDDFTECSSADEVVKKVTSDRNGIGFILYHGQPLPGVKMLPIAKSEDDPAVALKDHGLFQESYPLAEPLVLYLHPDAPGEARKFCRFAGGPEGAEIVKQCGLWPEYELEKARGRQRLADAEVGKGEAITACDLTGSENLMRDLSLEFVKATTAVQLKFVRSQGEVNKGVIDLLLADGPLTAKEERSANLKSPSPKSIELGHVAVAVIVHPDNRLESLPLDEARAIFTGEIKKWPAVSGPASAIKVYGLKQASPTAQVLKDVLNQGGGKKTIKYTPLPDHHKVVLTVARDPAAIAFVDMSQLSPNEKSVKMVPVFEGTAFSKPESKTGDDANPQSNPLSRTLTLYVSPNASQTAKDFAEFLTPERCKEIIAQHNLLPPAHANLTAKEIRPNSAPPPTDMPFTPSEELEPASADDPLPLLLDDPDAPQESASLKSKRAGAKPKSERAPSDAPAPAESAKPTSEPQLRPRAASEPAKAKEAPKASALFDEPNIWLVGAAGVMISLLGFGWLSAPRRKRPRR